MFAETGNGLIDGERRVPGKTLKVLVVDDTEVNLGLFDKFIRRMGHETISATNGLEAVARFEECRPDLVLMDVMMPEMDGYEATRRIRTLCDDNWVPIIFMSAKVSVDDQVMGLEAGGDDYLTKPVNLKILAAKITAMQRIAEMQQALEETASELQQYRDDAEQEMQLATRLMARITRSASLADPLLKVWTLPAVHMSGDLVAAARPFDDRLYVLLADATGHGLSAALMQMPVSQTFYDMAQAGYSVSSIVTAMNRQLRALMPRDRFVAATVVVFDERNRLFEVWNGGNPEALLVDDDAGVIHRFEPRSPPLGIVGEDDFDARTEILQVAEGAELLLYSDGVLDADDAQGDCFGESGLALAVDLHREQGVCQRVAAALREHLGGRSGQDDISVVGIRCPFYEC